MALPKQKLREIIFQLIYSADFVDSSDEEMIDLMMEQLAVTKKTVREAISRKEEVLQKREELDSLIREVSKAYDFERITRTERNVLRLAVYELLYDPLIPPKVVIAEAVRLARKFASPEGADFVNALVHELFIRREGASKQVSAE